jgi:hypothetical protein
VARVEKKAAKEGRTIVFIDESGFYLLPMVVRTYAPWVAHRLCMSSCPTIIFR